MSQTESKHKQITLCEELIPQSDTSLDILSFDIGTINMGVTRIRYDYATLRVTIMNAMLLSIFNPLQIVNDNDRDDESKQVTFPVSAYYHNGTAPTEAERRQLNRSFSAQQRRCRKRALIADKTEQTLQYVSGQHPSRTVKRRRTKLEQSNISKSLEENWALIGAQLVHAIEAHDWISNTHTIDFILLEQQERTNVKMRSIMMALSTYFELKRFSHHSAKPRRVRAPQTVDSQWHEAPFIKICSSSNKLSADTFAALQTTWQLRVKPDSPLRIGGNEMRKMLKKHFKREEHAPANTETYSKRKISSSDEITKLFCRDIIQRARSLSPDSVDVCPAAVVDQLVAEPANAYAHWITAQLKEKNNVTDALLQAFAWIEQASLPESQLVSS